MDSVEDRGNVFFQNVGWLSPEDKTLHSHHVRISNTTQWALIPLSRLSTFAQMPLGWGLLLLLLDIAGGEAMVQLLGMCLQCCFLHWYSCSCAAMTSVASGILHLTVAELQIVRSLVLHWVPLVVMAPPHHRHLWAASIEPRCNQIAGSFNTTSGQPRSSKLQFLK